MANLRLLVPDMDIALVLSVHKVILVNHEVLLVARHYMGLVSAYGVLPS